jgi:hypothetical protein
MRIIVIAVFAALLLATPAVAANVYVTTSMWGNHVVHIDGWLNLGDEKKVAAIDFHDPEHTVVQATGRGGYMYPAHMMVSLSRADVDRP